MKHQPFKSIIMVVNRSVITVSPLGKRRCSCKHHHPQCSLVVASSGHFISISTLCALQQYGTTSSFLVRFGQIQDQNDHKIRAPLNKIISSMACAVMVYFKFIMKFGVTCVITADQITSWIVCFYKESGETQALYMGADIFHQLTIT